jgi:hypothetical protein
VIGQVRMLVAEQGPHQAVIDHGLSQSPTPLPQLAEVETAACRRAHVSGRPDAAGSSGSHPPSLWIRYISGVSRGFHVPLIRCGKGRWDLPSSASTQQGVPDAGAEQELVLRTWSFR